MAGYLLGLVTFVNNGQRNTARSHITTWVANWNATHPSQSPLTGASTDTTAFDPDMGATLPALTVRYTCEDYATVLTIDTQMGATVPETDHVTVLSMSLSPIPPPGW